MKRLSFLVLALGGATVAFADLPEISINLGGESLSSTQVLFSNVSAPYSAFTAATGILGQEDYQASPALMAGKPLIALSSFRFVGGVTNANGILDFFFLDSSGANVVSSFALQFATPGNAIYSITGLGGLQARANGRLQIQARTGTTGQWLMTTTAPSIGTSSLTVGTGSALNPPRDHAFEITGAPVPEPGTMLALGAGLAMLARRRRRA